MRWADPTPERVQFVGENLRRRDLLEVFASHRLDGLSAVFHSVDESEVCHAIEDDEGIPLALCGLAPDQDAYLIWLLQTEGLLATRENRWQFIRSGSLWVEAMGQRLAMDNGCAVFENWAMAKSVDSLRWLRHLGFKVAQPMPRGPSAELFCHFHRHWTR